jgi:hypothetical protein
MDEDRLGNKPDFGISTPRSLYAHAGYQFTSPADSLAARTCQIEELTRQQQIARDATEARRLQEGESTARQADIIHQRNAANDVITANYLYE